MRNKVIQFRRKREDKTNYRKRLELLKSKKTRLVVRKTLRYIIAQFIIYEPTGDKVMFNVTSKELKKLGWESNLKNLPSAYLTGLLLGKKSKGKIKEAILDIGNQRSNPKSRLYATVKGVIDSGISIACSNDAFPDEERLKGKHTKSSDKFDDIKKKIGE